MTTLPNMLMHQPADTVVDAVALELVHWLSDLRDVVAFVSALPQPTPALAALLQLHQAIDLTQHWPCLNLQNIPKRHINVGIAALAAFPRVAVAPATNLRWLSAPLPRTTSVHMPLKSCNRTTLAFARAWGSSVRHVWVRNANALLPHVQEVLALCQHLDSADLLVSTATNAGLWVDALTRPACPFFALTVDISYMYASAAECMPLAQAILSSPSLRRLSLICNAAGIHDALLASKGDLHHVTKFCAVGMPAQPLIKKTDPAKLLNVLCSGTFDLWRCSALQCLSLTHGSLDWPRIATGCCPNLRFVTLFGTIADADMPLVAQWLSTSRVLRCVQTPSDSVGELGAQAMAGALPQWIARGLEMFRLGRNLLSKHELLLLVHALTVERSRSKPLEAYLSLGNRALDADEMHSLLAAVGACQSLSLTLNGVQSYATIGDPELAAMTHVDATRQQLVLTSSPKQNSELLVTLNLVVEHNVVLMMM